MLDYFRWFELILLTLCNALAEQEYRERQPHGAGTDVNALQECSNYIKLKPHDKGSCMGLGRLKT